MRLAFGLMAILSYPVAWVVGQAAPSAVNNDNIYGLVGTTASSAVFLWLFLRAEKERQKVQKLRDRERNENLDLLKRLLPLLGKHGEALKEVSSSMASTVERATRPEVEDALSRASRLADELAGIVEQYRDR